MSEPYEIIGAPLTLWLAPIGTTFPAIDDVPDAGDWTLIGTNGDRNYDEAGVTTTHKQSLNFVRTAGSVGPVKAFRPDEDLMVQITLLDMTLEQFSHAISGVAPSVTAAGAGTAGFKKLGLSRGINVPAYALLARGASPYDEAMAAQYEIPRCVQSGSPSPVFTKGKPAALALEFTALEDLDASSEAERFGRLIAQHQAAL